MDTIGRLPVRFFRKIPKKSECSPTRANQSGKENSEFDLLECGPEKRSPRSSSKGALTNSLLLLGFPRKQLGQVGVGECSLGGHGLAATDCAVR